MRMDLIQPFINAADAVLAQGLHTPTSVANLSMEEEAYRRKGVAALGLSIGPVHADLRLTAEGPVLLEIGARAIGGVCGRAHTYRLGLDYQELVLRASLGWPINVTLQSQTPSGVMMIPPPCRGRLESVEALTALYRARACGTLSSCQNLAISCWDCRKGDATSGSFSRSARHRPKSLVGSGNPMAG